MILILKD